MTKNNEVQFNDDKCLDAPQEDPGSFVEMITCHGLRGNQEWKHDKKKVNNNTRFTNTTNTQSANRMSGHEKVVSQPLLIMTTIKTPIVNRG